MALPIINESGAVIPFRATPTTKQRRAQSEGSRPVGRILLFTGVRYERPGAMLMPPVSSGTQAGETARS